MSATRPMSQPGAVPSATTHAQPCSRLPVLAALTAVMALGVGVVLGVTPASAAQGPVGLGTADSFAVLAGSGVTNTGPTTIDGDIGTFPTLSQTGFGSITLTGTNHLGDAVTQGAKDDLVTAYNDAAGRNPVTNVPVELGGSLLVAGVYTSPTLGLTGTLTLDAQGSPDAMFIFQAGTTLIAESNSRVLLINGANPCNVVWQIGSSATFKTGTQFVGDVLAHTSITAQTEATFQGRLLARTGAVTLDTNTITNGGCRTRGGDDTTDTTSGTTDTTGGTTDTTGGTTGDTTGGTTDTTGGTTVTTGGTPVTIAATTVGSSIPSGAPSAVTLNAAPESPARSTQVGLGSPGLPEAPQGGTPGETTGTKIVTSTGTPVGTPSMTPSGTRGGTPTTVTRTSLPVTGGHTTMLLVAVAALLVLGATLLAAGRVRRSQLNTLGR